MTDFLEQKKERKMFYKIAKAIKEQYPKYKLVHIGAAKWTNEITYKQETVNNLYILGYESSGRPLIINRIELVGNDEDAMFCMNTRLNHTNICSSSDCRSLLLSIDNKPYNARFIGQEFCNPITLDQVYNGNEKDIKNLIKANLMSQNFDDAFTSIEFVENEGEDRVIEHKLSRYESPLELLLGDKSYNIRCYDTTELNKKLKNIKNIKEDEIFAKRKEDIKYTKILKEHFRKYRYAYSDYYPTFDKKYIDKMEIEITKDKYDIGVYGLGSAGTAILDQLCRSNWLNDIYLCDFDTVEAKNINNQWYTGQDEGNTKTSASRSIISRLSRTIKSTTVDFNIITDTKKFEETDYKDKEFKYVISGFDSINVRQKLFNEIKNGNLKTKYLIDCRYLDLASSVYIIDTDNKEEMDFYEANLIADGEMLKKEKHIKERMSIEEFKDWLNTENVFKSECSRIKHNYFPTEYINCEGSCGEEQCVEAFYNAYKNTYPVKGIDYKEEENTCIKFNYIDIYKYVGAIVFGAFRKLQNGQKKPFTLLEAQTDVNGLPNYMIVKE